TNESDIKVKGNTHLEGSVLASGTIDSNGNLIDNNSLNLETKTITYKDLSNIKYEKSSSTDIGIGQTLSLDYKAGLNIEKTKTLSTLGNGNITLTGKDKQIDERLNRDVNNTKKELYKVDQTKGVDLTVDVRMLTEDGRKEIKKDMTVAYDHGTDFVEAAKQISEDDNLNVLNYVDQVKNNIATTKVKEHLKYTNDGQDILKALESNKNSQEYQEAEVKAGNLYQKFRGIEETKIIHFDAKTTDKLELADINSNGLQVNVEGATITKGENKGDIFLDVSGDSNGLSSKANSTIVLGHELGETQYLENGNGIVFEDSYDTKEAMNNTLGDRYLSRLNEASNGVLTNTTTTYTPNNYVNSGTIYSNSVQIKENGIEFRKLALIEKDFINKNASMFASQNSFTPFLSKTGAQPMKLSKAHKILTEAANYLVDKSSNNKTKYRLESVVNPGDVTRKELQKGIEFLQKQSEGLTINYSPLGKEDNQKAFTAKPDHYIISGLDLDKNTPVQTSLLGGIEVIVTGGPAAKIFIKSGAKTLPKLLKKVDELDNKFGIYLSIKKDNLPSNKFNNLFSKQVDYNTIDSSLPHGTPDPSIAGGIGFGGVQIYEFIKSIFSDQENKKNKE
ncbi:MAG: hypothetical protein HRT40_11945, partial [Campylobacteraceae bacterium]|nr:hypothetical protein [Campylobacteraceae bacterium]